MRIRWFDSEPDDATLPVDWRAAAMIIATVFLTFRFWFAGGIDLWILPLPQSTAVVATAALLLTGLFFVGPALATRAASRPLFAVVEASFGSIPAFGLRLCCVLFLVSWMATQVAIPLIWWLPSVLRRDVSATESGVIAAGVLTYLFATGFQSVRTSAKLALITNKLGIAILIAALVRVRSGWAAIPQGFSVSADRSMVLQLSQGLSWLASYVAPLAFLAANFGYRSGGRKQVAMIAFMGITVPLSVTLVFTGVIAVATHSSRFYRPSLEPNVAMALFSRSADSANPGRMLAVILTTFGALRFGARALAESVPIHVGRLRWVMAGCAVLAIATSATFFFHHGHDSLLTCVDITATCLTVTAGVVTADFLTRRWRSGQVRRFDWVGVIALVAGFVTSLYVDHRIGVEAWWHPGLLPSYGVGLVVCAAGRGVETFLRG